MHALPGHPILSDQQKSKAQKGGVFFGGIWEWGGGGGSDHLPRGWWTIAPSQTPSGIWPDAFLSNLKRGTDDSEHQVSIPIRKLSLDTPRARAHTHTHTHTHTMTGLSTRIGENGGLKKMALLFPLMLAFFVRFPLCFDGPCNLLLCQHPTAFPTF